MLKRKFNAGYTIDQTILVVAIISILVTMVIGSLGMNLIARTGGTKVAAQFRQVEDAIGQFYAVHRQWPHQALSISNGTNLNQALATALALTGDVTGNAAGASYNSGVVSGKLQNLVTGFPVMSGALTHGFDGGDSNDYVAVWAIHPPASTGLNTAKWHMVVEFLHVPLSETLEADAIIDGNDDDTDSSRAQVGRLYFKDSTDPTCGSEGETAAFSSSETKTVCYVANAL